jgi:hypothetical protein
VRARRVRPDILQQAGAGTARLDTVSSEDHGLSGRACAAVRCVPAVCAVCTVCAPGGGCTQGGAHRGCTQGGAHRGVHLARLRNRTMREALPLRGPCNRRKLPLGKQLVVFARRRAAHQRQPRSVTTQNGVSDAYDPSIRLSSSSDVASTRSAVAGKADRYCWTLEYRHNIQS